MGTEVLITLPSRLQVKGTNGVAELRPAPAAPRIPVGKDDHVDSGSP
jgi:hypothetical protein